MTEDIIHIEPWRNEESHISCPSQRKYVIYIAVKSKEDLDYSLNDHIYRPFEFSTLKWSVGTNYNHTCNIRRQQRITISLRLDKHLIAHRFLNTVKA